MLFILCWVLWPKLRRVGNSNSWETILKLFTRWQTGTAWEWWHRNAKWRDAQGRYPPPPPPPPPRHKHKKAPGEGPTQDFIQLWFLSGHGAPDLNGRGLACPVGGLVWLHGSPRIWFGSGPLHSLTHWIWSIILLPGWKQLRSHPYNQCSPDTSPF